MFILYSFKVLSEGVGQLSGFGPEGWKEVFDVSVRESWQEGLAVHLNRQNQLDVDAMAVDHGEPCAPRLQPGRDQRR